MALSQAGEFAKQLRDLQTDVQQLGDLRLEVKAIRDDLRLICQPRGSRESPALPPPEPSTRIEGTTWAEEMDIRDPIDEEDEAAATSRDEVRLVEVGPRTEQHIKRSFVSMSNNDRRQLRNVFALPKVAVTKTPSLDPVMAAQCSKSTKTNDKVLARLQALTLDAVGPLTHLLDKLNSEEAEIDADEVGYAVESAITLIGNASSQMSILRRQKILEEYNKDLLSFAQDREEEFTKAAPQLFGAQFPKEAADHLDQVAALRRAKSSSSQGFHKASPPRWSGQRSYAARQRPKPYSRPKTGYSKPKALKATK